MKTPCLYSPFTVGIGLEIGGEGILLIFGDILGIFPPTVGVEGEEREGDEFIVISLLLLSMLIMGEMLEIGRELLLIRGLGSGGEQEVVLGEVSPPERLPFGFGVEVEIEVVD